MPKRQKVVSLLQLGLGKTIDSAVPTEVIFAQEVKKLQVDQFKRSEQVIIELFERYHACVVGWYRTPKECCLLQLDNYKLESESSSPEHHIISSGFGLISHQNLS